MRKLYIVLSLLVLASMLITACGDQPTPTAPQPAPPTPVPTPSADLTLFFREEGMPATEGSIAQEGMWVHISPGHFGENVSVSLVMSDGETITLNPMPQETFLPGKIGGSLLQGSIVVTSSGIYSFVRLWGKDRALYNKAP